MARLDELTPKESSAWLEVLAQTARHDFYHLPDYHALAEASGQGSARLFVYRDGGSTIALPLLLRPLAELPGIGTDWADWHDATSVYGYAGPVCSDDVLPDSVLGGFQSALLERLRTLRVVSVFSRLHPFIPQRACL